MKFSITSLFAALLLTGSAVALVIPRSGVPLTQAQAEARLKPAGITAFSSGGCTNKAVKTCTSYDGILSGTVDGVLTLQRAAGLGAMTITGGTEIGHAAGPMSHASGHKVDIRKLAKLDSYIKNTFTKIANRGDGFPQWRAASGNLYCDEGNHWDITYL